MYIAILTRTLLNYLVILARIFILTFIFKEIIIILNIGFEQ